MAEKRASCKVAAQALSQVIGFEIAGSEVSGTRVTELDNLTNFYKRYTELLVDVGPVMASCVSAGRASEILVAEFQKVLAKALPLKLLPTYGDLASRIKSYTDVQSFAAQWNEKAVCESTVAEVAPELGADPTLKDLAGFLKAQPQQATALMAFAAAESKARDVLSIVRGMLVSAAGLHLKDLAPFEEAVAELQSILPSTSASFSGRCEQAGVASVLASLKAAKFILDEVALMSTFGEVSILGADAITILHGAATAAEGIKSEARLPAESFASKYPGDALKTQSDAITAVKDQLGALCANARKNLPVLGNMPDGDVIRYCTIGGMRTPEAQAFITTLFPWWRRVVVSEETGDVTAIEGMDGEILALGNAVPAANKALAEVLPLLVEEQQTTIESATLDAQRLAHAIAIGKSSFTADSLIPMPSQVALRFVLLLWTELTEGALGAKGHATSTAPSVSELSPSTNSFNVSIQSLRRIGAESRGGPSRPTSAASRISSPRKSMVEDPRPGSASTTLFRKSTKADERLGKLARDGASADLFDSSLARQSATSSARTRRVATSASPVLSVNGASPKTRAQSSIASHARLGPILLDHLGQMQAYLNATNLTAVELAKLSFLLQWQHRFVSIWESQVSKAASGDDYLWRREPRMYVVKRRVLLQQNDSTIPVNHFFIPLCSQSVLSSTDQLVWQHMLLMHSISRPPLFIGQGAPIATFTAICGQPSVDVFGAHQLPAHGRSAGSGVVIIHCPEMMPTVDQERIAQWLGEHPGGDIVILSETEEGLHPFIRAQTSPFLAPPVDQAATRASVDRALLAAGLVDTEAIADQLMSFLTLSADIGGWAIPFDLLHESIVSITATLKEGVSLDVALRRSIFGTLLARAPIHTLPFLTKASRSIFGYSKETMYYPQLSEAMAEAFAQLGMMMTDELRAKCKAIYDFVLQDGDDILIVRGEARVGKLSVVRAALGVVSTMSTPRSSAIVASCTSPPSVDVLVSLNMPVDLASLRGAAGKVIVISDDDILPRRIVQPGGVRVVLVDPSIPSSVMLAVADSGIGERVDGLLEAHGAAIVAMARACGNSCNAPRIMATLLSLLKAVMGSFTSLSVTDVVVERAFWFAATWACAPNSNPAWLDFAVSRMSEGSLPQPDLFSCGLGANGEWQLWTRHTPVAGPLASLALSRCASLFKLFTSSGENVMVVGRNTKGVAAASNYKMGSPLEATTTSFIPSRGGDAYRRVAVPHLWEGPLQRGDVLPRVPMPIVCVPDILKAADCDAIGAPLGSLYQSLASSTFAKGVATLSSLAAAGELLEMCSDKDDAAKAIVACLAKAQLPRGDHAEVDALLGSEDLCIVIGQGGVASAASRGDAAMSAGLTPSEAYFANAIAALISTSRYAFALTAPKGCVDIVAKALDDACAVVGKASRVTTTLPSALSDVAARDSVVVYRPVAFPSSEELGAIFDSEGIVLDLSALNVSDEQYANLLLVGMVVGFTFTVEDQYYLLKSAGDVGGLAAVIDQLPRGAITPAVFRAAVALASRISGRIASVSTTTTGKARLALRSFKDLENRIAKKPSFSQAERDYRGPESGPEGMLLYEGTTVFKDYPEEPLRLMLFPKLDDKGAFKEFTHVSVCIGTAQCDVVSLTATEGGQCRARQEAGGNLIISASPYELRLTPIDAEGGGYEGTLAESAKVSVPLGRVALGRTSGSASIHWLRGMEDSETAAEDEVEEQRNEERDRLQSTASTSLRVALRLTDQKLRESFGSVSTSDQLATAAAVLVLCASLDTQSRLSAVEAAQAAYHAAVGAQLPDPFSKEVAAVVFGQSPSAVALWLGNQRPELPPGPHGEQVALAVRAFGLVGLTPVVNDPCGVFKAWADKQGVARQSNDRECNGAQVNGEHTVGSLAAAFGGTNVKVDLTSLTSVAEQDQTNREAVDSLLEECIGVEGEELLAYLSSPKAQEMLAKVAIIPEAAVAGATTKKKVADKETVSAPLRLAAIVMHCARLLPSIQPIYCITTSDLIAFAAAALQVPSKGSQAPVEAAVRAFGSQVLGTVLQEDRLLLSAGIAMAVLVEEKRVDPSSFGLALRLLRNADPSTLDEASASMLEAAQVAFSDWQRAQETSKARKKEVKELKDFMSPRMMPSYPFMGPQQWANVLCLADAVPSLSGLPAALQHGDLPKGVTRQDKWAEWLENCIGPLPTYEKSTAVSPLDQLLVILALRPSKLVVALLQFVVETLGQEFPDPYVLDDPIPSLLQVAKVSRRAVVLHSPLASPQSIQQTIVSAAKASVMAPSAASPTGSPSKAQIQVSATVKPPAVYVESAFFPARVKEAIAAATAGGRNDWVLIEDCDKVPSSTMATLVGSKVPEGYSGTIYYSVAPSPHVNASVFTAIPRVTCNFVWSLRRTMTSHYNTLKVESVPLTPANHKLIFVTTFLVSALEQRSRFGNLGFTASDSFATCERDVTAAVSAVLKATSLPRGSPSSPPTDDSSQIAWDALRDQLFMILSGLAKTHRDRSIVQAYIDWLIHPQVVLGDAELGNGVVIPSTPTFDSHFLTISQLPDTTSTEMIGLNTGVELRQREQESERIFNFLEDAFVPTPTRESIDALVQQVSSALPTPSPLIIADAIAACDASDLAVPRALCKEWEAFNAALASIHSDLSSAHAKNLQWRTAFVQERVPPTWERPDEPHGSIQMFVGKLQTAYSQLMEWTLRGVPRTLIVSSLADARGFVTACRNDSALTLGLPISRVAVNVEALQDPPESAAISHDSPITAGFVFVSLQMVGALIDRKGMLQELFEHAIYWWQMPTTEVGGVRVTFGPANEDGSPLRPRSKPMFAPTRPSTAFHNSTARAQPAPRVLQERRTSVSKRGVFSAPLYASASQRAEDFVGFVPVECFEDHNYWILRGAAIVGGN